MRFGDSDCLGHVNSRCLQNCQLTGAVMMTMMMMSFLVCHMHNYVQNSGLTSCPNVDCVSKS